MQFEIKKLKTNLTLSDETLCFSCEVWVDGIHTFNASNHGHGGDNLEIPVNKEKYEQAKAYVAGIKKPYTISIGGEKHEIFHDLESWTMNLIEEMEVKKRIKSQLSRKILLVGISDGKVYSVNLNWNKLPEEHKEIVRNKYKEKYFILNDIPFQQVWDKYKNLF